MNERESRPDEWLSDLMDGHAAGSEREKSLSALLADAAAQRNWHLWHIAGDAMRSADLAPSPSEFEFLERLEARLASESISFGVDAVELRPTQSHAGPVESRYESSNTGFLRGRGVSGALAFVVCAVVAVVLWSAIAGPQVSESTSPVSQVSTSVETVASAVPTEQIMIRDPELDALLAAHGAMGGNSALQLPSGFLRNATFERPSR